MISKSCNLYSLDGTKHAAGKSDLAIQGVAQLALRPNLPHSPLPGQGIDHNMYYYSDVGLLILLQASVIKF